MSAAEHLSVIDGGDPALTGPGIADKNAAEGGAPPLVINNKVLSNRDDYLNHLRGVFDRADFTTVIQHGRVDPDYSLVFGGTTVNVGDDLEARSAITRKLAAEGIDIDYYAPKAWAVARRCMTRLAEIVDGDDGADEAMEWLAVYFEQRADEFGVRAVKNRSPHRRDGRLFLNVSDFTTFVGRALGQKITGAEVRRRLRRLGFDKAPYADGMVSVRESSATASNRYLTSPDGFKLLSEIHPLVGGTESKD